MVWIRGKPEEKVLASIDTGRGSRPWSSGNPMDSDDAAS